MRREKAGKQSIVGRINSMTVSLMLLLGIPVIAAMLTELIIAGQYAQINDQMGTIAELKPVVETQIPEAIWSAVSGRASMEESGVEKTIAEVNRTIEQIAAQTEEDRRLGLTVARRTMDTLSQYTEQIRANLAEQRPVTENEAVLEEIRGVASLIGTMLNNYVFESIREGNRMVQGITRMAYAGSVAEVALLALAIVLTVRFRRKTARFVREPIAKLEGITGQLAAGDMSARLPLTQVEELWKLTGQVNVMADDLEEMMRQRVKDERSLKKAELRILQAQINPHFLYNTLDAIVWKAEAGDQEEVIHLTRALSDYFRISLSSGADWIPIEQEKKHLAGYLSIQKTRYNDILNYEIDIEEGIGGYYVPKLLLQPLVENALYHGIKHRRGGGWIHVSGKQDGEELTFTVSDTGRGMDPEQLENVRTRMRESSPPALATGTGGFGLVNVNLRLRLYYNRPEGVQIESGPGGTTVQFRVPIRTREMIEKENEPG